MTEHDIDASNARGLDRRQLLMAGGAAAAVAAAGATVLGAGPASAAPLVPVLTPVSPERLFDSRDGLGPISNGFTDTITGDPATVLAFLMNVTVVNTTGFGWITVYSADLIDVPSTSTLNWYGPGQTMVNTAYTFIRPSDSGIKVNCGGGGEANYVLDLTGVLFMYDAGTALASVPAAIQADVATGFTAVRS